MTRITDYTVLAAPAAGDVLPAVDISDTTMSLAGTTKQVTVETLLCAPVGEAVTLLPSGDTSGVTDSANFAAIWAFATHVRLLPAVYSTITDINPPPFSVLQGSRGAIAAADVESQQGTVIQAVAAWSTSSPEPGIISILDKPTGGYAVAQAGVQLRDLIVDGTLGPSNLDGINGYGAVSAVLLDHVGGNNITGYGVKGYIGAGGQPDGWNGDTVIMQNVTKDSFGTFIWNDCTFKGFHAQGGGTGGDGFNINQGSVRLIAPRSEFRQHSFTINAQSIPMYAQNAYTPIILVAPTSDQSNGHGINILNTGSQDPLPIVLIAPQLDAAGQNGNAGGGGYAGISIVGSGHKVQIIAPQVWTGSSAGGTGPFGPEYGLLAAEYSAGKNPLTIHVVGGSLNGESAAISNDGTTDNFYIDPSVQTITGDVHSGYTYSADPFECVAKFKSVAVESAASGGQLLTVTGTIASPGDSLLQITADSAGDNAFGVDVSGDPDNRFKIDSHGKLFWGTGSAAQDTEIARTGAAQLQLTDNGSGNSPQLRITAATTASGVALLQVDNNAGGDLAAAIDVTGDTNNRWKIDSNGKMQWGSGSATQDTDLYRASAGVLQTDEAFTATGAITSSSYVQANRFTPTGLFTAVNAASRYIGAMASGTTPASGGPYSVGDWVIVQTGAISICTVAGSPGTWTLA